MIEIRINEDGTLDEIVAKQCVVHLEQMDDKHWWLGIYDGDSEVVHVEFFGCRIAKITNHTRNRTTDAPTETVADSGSASEDGTDAMYCRRIV